jgi:hypothetical protein
MGHFNSKLCDTCSRSHAVIDGTNFPSIYRCIIDAGRGNCTQNRTREDGRLVAMYLRLVVQKVPIVKTHLAWETNVIRLFVICLGLHRGHSFTFGKINGLCKKNPKFVCTNFWITLYE